MRDFKFEASEAFLFLGHTERKETGELVAETLVDKKLFEDVEIITLNSADTKFGSFGRFLGGAALKDGLKTRAAITHSAGIMRVPHALQIIAFNGPEQSDYLQQIRSAIKIGNDPMKERSEPGAHKTGISDLAKAGLQLVTSPFSTAKTLDEIKEGYSASKRLAYGAEDFPAGRALIHSELDGFGFPARSYDGLARSMGVVVKTIPDHYHNEFLFAPAKTIDAIVSKPLG